MVLLSWYNFQTRYGEYFNTRHWIYFGILYGDTVRGICASGFEIVLQQHYIYTGDISR